MKRATGCILDVGRRATTGHGHGPVAWNGDVMRPGITVPKGPARACRPSTRALHGHHPATSRHCVNGNEHLSLVVQTVKWKRKERVRVSENTYSLNGMMVFLSQALARACGRSQMVGMSEQVSRYSHSATSLPMLSCTRVTCLFRFAKSVSTAERVFPFWSTIVMLHGLSRSALRADMSR